MDQTLQRWTQRLQRLTGLFRLMLQVPGDHGQNTMLMLHPHHPSGKYRNRHKYRKRTGLGVDRVTPPLGVLGAKMSGVQKGWGAGDPPEGRFIRSTFLSPGRFLQPLQTYLSLSSVFRHSQKGRPDTVVITV